MIITCPECATRYDLEDERFLPNGRSVRCTACGESWFVPAPETIEMLSRRDAEPQREPAPRHSPRQSHHHDERYGAHEDDGRGHDWAPRHERFEDAPAPRDADRRRDYDENHGLRAQRPEPAAKFDADGDRYDLDGRPEEAEISIVHPEKDLLPPRDEKGRFMPRAAEDDDDDVLFESPPESKSHNADAKHASIARDAQADAPPQGWRQGKQFYVEDTDAEPKDDPRPFFAKHFSKNKREDEVPSADHRSRHADGYGGRESVRMSDDVEPPRDAAFKSAQDEDAYRREPEPVVEQRHADYSDDARRHDERTEPDRDRMQYDERGRERDSRYYESRADDDRDYDRGYDHDHDRRYDYDDDVAPSEATVLDADWEDVDNGTGPRFGRRIREQRRRATALARLEDVRRFEPEALDDEFFRSLRVTPYELEKAVRKARRRAEARDKNRMTPWRAFGWSAWVAAVAGAAYAVVAYRDEIVKVAPTTADAYAVVGIETDPYGLKIENVRHRLAMSTGGPTIEISGALRNRGADALDAPLLQAEALGPRGELLARWTFRPDEPTVSGDGVVPFTTRNTAPDGVTEVALTFAPTQSSIAPQ